MGDQAGRSETLEELGAQLRAARSSGGVFQLPPRLAVRLSGRDAFRYLNGQITRDLSRLSSGEAVAACILTPKGKLSAPLLIRREGGESQDLLIEADPSLEESLLARLERYLVADEVTLSVEPARPGLHFFASLVDALPWRDYPGIRVQRLGVPGVDRDLDGLPEPLPDVLDPRVVETLRIERGIPLWGRDVSEETLPPEAGFDRTHIDYNRGCYPGQEVISRLKSIGRVNRLLTGLRSAPGLPLHAGMPLLNGAGKEIGRITSAAKQYDTGSWVALGMLPRETAEPLFALDPLTEEKRPLSIVQITGS
jgi:tRNA-modifying protein YgfZ